MIKRLSIFSVFILFVTLFVPSLSKAANYDYLYQMKSEIEVDYKKVWRVYFSDEIDPTIDLNDYISIENKEGDKAELFIEQYPHYVTVRAPMDFYKRKGEYRLIVRPFPSKQGELLSKGLVQPFKMVNRPKSEYTLQLRKDSKNEIKYKEHVKSVKEQEIAQVFEDRLIMKKDHSYEVGDILYLEMTKESEDRIIKITKVDGKTLFYESATLDEAADEIDISVPIELDFEAFDEELRSGQSLKNVSLENLDNRGIKIHFDEYPVPLKKEKARVLLTGSVSFELNRELSIFDVQKVFETPAIVNAKLDYKTNVDLDVKVDGKLNMGSGKGIKLSLTEALGKNEAIKAIVKTLRGGLFEFDPYIYIAIDTGSSIKVPINYEMEQQLEFTPSGVNVLKNKPSFELPEGASIIDNLLSAESITLEAAPHAKVGAHIIGLDLVSADLGVGVLYHHSNQQLDKLKNPTKLSPYCSSERFGQVTSIEADYLNSENVKELVPLRHIDWLQQEDSCAFENPRFQIEDQYELGSSPTLTISEKGKSKKNYDLLVDFIDLKTKEKTTYTVDPHLYRILNTGKNLEVYHPKQTERIYHSPKHYLKTEYTDQPTTTYIDYQFTEEYFPLHDLSHDKRWNVLREIIYLRHPIKKGPIKPGETVYIQQYPWHTGSFAVPNYAKVSSNNGKSTAIDYALYNAKNHRLQAFDFSYNWRSSSHMIMLPHPKTGFAVVTNRSEEDLYVKEHPEYSVHERQEPALEHVRIEPKTKVKIQAIHQQSTLSRFSVRSLDGPIKYITYNHLTQKQEVKGLEPNKKVGGTTLLDHEMEFTNVGDHALELIFPYGSFKVIK